MPRERFRWRGLRKGLEGRVPLEFDTPLRADGHQHLEQRHVFLLGQQVDLKVESVSTIGDPGLFVLADQEEPDRKMAAGE